MIKLTVLYGHPEDPDAFEKYYESTHLPLAGKIMGLDRLELTKFTSSPDGGKPAFYRMAELYFATREKMDQARGSAEGQAAVADFDNFATGGVTVLIGSLWSMASTYASAQEPTTS